MARRKTTTDKKSDEKNTVETKPETSSELAESQFEVEEKLQSEIPEIKSVDSTIESLENPIEIPKKKTSVYKWIFIASALILVVLITIYFWKIKEFFLEDISRIYIIGGVIVALIVGLIVWYVPKRQVKKLANKSSEDKLTEFEREKESLKLEDDTRKTMAQLVGGVFLIAGLFVTYNTYRLGTDNYRLGLEQQKITSRGQITDRFNKAVEHLANENLSVRLGGLYALEQILNDSPEEHQTIIEVLSAYIREKTNRRLIEQMNSKNPDLIKSEEVKIVGVATDIQTALTILSRRPVGENYKEGTINLRFSNLRGSFIKPNIVSEGSSEEMSFNFVNFRGADLSEVDFATAEFTNVDLSFANLRKAELESVKFIYSNLNSADLEGANLERANFLGTELRAAKLNNAKLIDAHIYSSTLISAYQLENALFDFIYIEDKKLDRESALKYFREKEVEENNQQTPPDK